MRSRVVRAGFTPGHVKHGGRVKGTPNKDRDALLEEVKRTVMEVWKIPDYDPVVSMAVRANDPSVAEGIRQRADEVVAEYCHSKRKALQITSDVPIAPAIVFSWADEDDDEPDD